MTVYASIGNSDDKLTQQSWSWYIDGLLAAINRKAERIHGVWYSLPDSPYQNACVCFDIHPTDMEGLKVELGKLAAEYGQDSIAWAEATTQFITATQADR